MELNEQRLREAVCSCGCEQCENIRILKSAAKLFFSIQDAFPSERQLSIRGFGFTAEEKGFNRGAKCAREQILLHINKKLMGLPGVIKKHTPIIYEEDEKNLLQAIRSELLGREEK